jgi:phosphatidylglycerol:prolipoprotein diacylglycerol transferase
MLGPLPVYGFGVMVLVALSVGATTLLVAAHRTRTSLVMAGLLCALLPGALYAGARAGWWLSNFDKVGVLPWSEGGLALTPGLVACFVVAAVVGVAFEKQVAQALDVTVIGASSAVSVGRIGCFLAGCCFGKPTALPWAVAFPPGGRVPESLHEVPLHPTQLYLVAGFGAVAMALMWLAPRRRFPGQLFLLGAAAFALVSIGDRFVRFDLEPTVLTLSAWAGVFGVAIASFASAQRRAAAKA